MTAPRPKSRPAALDFRVNDPDAQRQEREIRGLREEDAAQAEREALAFGLSSASARELVGVEGK